MANKNKTPHSSKPFVLALGVILGIYLAVLAYLYISNIFSQKTLDSNQQKVTQIDSKLDSLKKTDEYQIYLMSKKINDLKTIPWYDSLTQLANIKNEMNNKLKNKVTVDDFVVDFTQVKMDGTVNQIPDLYGDGGVISLFENMLSKTYTTGSVIKPSYYIIPQISHEDGNSDYNFSLLIKLANGNKK